MSRFVNEFEVEEFVIRFTRGDTPNLADAAVLVSNLMDWTNRNSDGWPYWTLPQRAARKLIDALLGADRFDPVDISEAELKNGIRFVKSFLTKRGVDHSEVGL